MIFHLRNFYFRKGQSLVELLVAVGVAAIFLPALATGLVATRNGRVQEENRLQAVALIREAEEASRSVRENGWQAFATRSGGISFHPVVTGSSWAFLDNAETIGIFTRQMTMTPVNRTNGAIVLSGGTNDPSTKMVLTTVSWGPLPGESVSSTRYMTRYLDNLAHTETTQTDFNATGNSQTSVKVQATSGSSLPDDGEIILSQTGGFGDWCTPTLSLQQLDLPKNGAANAVAATQGTGNIIIAAGTGDNASGVSYANVTVSDPSFPTPPVATVSGTFNGYKTNGVFTEQNYAYLATDTSHQQGVIIKLTPGNYTSVGFLDLGTGTIKGQSIYVLNDFAYITDNNGKLYIFSLSADRTTNTLVGSKQLSVTSTCPPSGACNKVLVVGNNAYVAARSTVNQLQIINVATPSALPAPTNISVNGNEATDIFVNVPQNRAYLVTSQSATQPEFFLVNLANGQTMGSYDTSAHGNMSPTGVIAVSGAHAIIVGTGGQEYQVLLLSNEAAPAYCGGLDVDSGIRGISTVFTTGTKRAFSYIVTGDATAELKIIEGGPGATGTGSYVPSGTFTSAPFGPTTFDTAFNRFTADISQPELNGVQLQFGVADAVGNPLTCIGANYTYVGTDGSGTGATHYFTSSNLGTSTITGAVPFGNYGTYYKNPAKCFRYQVVLNTSDSTLTPVFKDITVNYSP